MYRDSFKLGVLVDEPVQLLDLAPVDLFHMLGARYMSTITLLPEVVRRHALSGKTDIITVCTGIFPAAYSGILDGHTVTGPRGLLPELQKKFPKVKKWEETRWSTDTLGTTKGNGGQAELWTSAGITNGHDVIAAYIRKHFGREIADCVLAMADVENRTREYNAGSVRETSWWLWLIVRSLFNLNVRTLLIYLVDALERISWQLVVLPADCC